MKNNVEVLVGIVSSECPICLEEFPSLQAELCGLSCGCQFCHQCLKAHVKEKISNGIIEVSCLNTVCNGIMTYDEIQAFCEDGYQQRIMNLRKSLEGARDKSLAWCPTRDCDTICEIQPPITNDAQIIRCDQCNNQFNLAELNEKNVVISLMGANENIISCPRCKLLMEKNGGCSVVRCNNCGWSFNAKSGAAVIGEPTLCFLSLIFVILMIGGIILEGTVHVLFFHLVWPSCILLVCIIVYQRINSM